MPIAHADGNYFADPETIKELEAEGRVLVRYSTPDGATSVEANPNGSINNIAGITNAGRNVFGLMPHPERACEPELGSIGGKGVFESILGAFSRQTAHV
jgi:phosphoribosylformylglycinamidine synthase